MSVAIPKTSESRPPGDPPIRTTFGGFSPDDRDPIDRVLTDSVERLLRTVDNTRDDRLEILLRLLEQRRRWLEAELDTERMMSPASLPPPSFDVFSLEYLLEPESRATMRYVGLLGRIDEAIEKVRSRIRLRNLFPEPSDS